MSAADTSTGGCSICFPSPAVPFSTIVVGRFAHLAPAIWFYAGHTLLIALVGMRLAAVTANLEHGEHLRRRQLSAVLLSVSSLLAIAISFVDPGVALWVLALNFTGPLLWKWVLQPAAARH
jgi:hypothetical protein